MDPAVAELPETAELLMRAAGVPREAVESPEQVFRLAELSPDPEGEAKRVLYLTRNRGAFVKPCPGTRNYLCCGYQILHVGSFCSMDCSYCILQTYFHPPVLSLFMNHRDLFSELTRVFADKPDNVRRLGTGEFTDSLLFEDICDLTPRLVSAFGTQDHAMLELKTKTVNISRLEGLPHGRKTVVAFSMNTERVIAENERRTAPLAARLAAAARVQEWGYPLAFHFDPLVFYPGCEAEYAGVMDSIAKLVRPGNLSWISLGSFRFPPQLKTVIERRFPGSSITCSEYLPGVDNKMRLFKPMRQRLFQELAGRLARMVDGLVYFCMEDEAVWKNALGFSPEEKGGLSGMLDRAAREVCGLRG
ncbi:MAG: spore photoproduct lyase family protein [Thermodesulfobacteriota bacterium]